MGADQLSTSITMLCDRMKIHPEEFINEHWNPIKANAWDDEPFSNVRWGNFIRATLTTGKELMFSDAEVEHIRECYKGVLRKRFEECIVKELVSGERQKDIQESDRQMNLPYISAPTRPSRLKTEMELAREEYQRMHLKDKGLL